MKLSTLLCKSSNRWFCYGVLTLLVVGVSFFAWATVSEIFSDEQDGTPALYRATIREIPLLLELARTPEERERGLSGRQELSDGRGMLFVYASDDYYGFWMPDMHFSIDIIWLDSVMRVVHIAESVAPESYPAVYRPDTPARFVLEVPAGWAKSHGITKGDTLVLER